MAPCKHHSRNANKHQCSSTQCTLRKKQGINEQHACACTVSAWTASSAVLVAARLGPCPTSTCWCQVQAHRLCASNTKATQPTPDLQTNTQSCQHACITLKQATPFSLEPIYTIDAFQTCNICTATHSDRGVVCARTYLDTSATTKLYCQKDSSLAYTPAAQH